MTKVTPNMNAQGQEVFAYIEAEITRSLLGSLTAMLSGESIESEKVARTDSKDQQLYYQQAFEPDGVGAIEFRFDTQGAVAIGRKLLVAAGLEGESDDMGLETLGEVLAQVSGRLSSAFSARVKKEISAKSLVKKNSGTKTGDSFTLKVIVGDAPPAFFTAIPNADLISALTPPALPALTAAPAASAAPAVSLRNLDLLLDVELPLSVSFGRAQLQLKDVIKLTTGSIVELNRSVSEPVDIIVNNCVIARGEVVVVEGNFGVRIKQIVSKEERIRSIA